MLQLIGHVTQSRPAVKKETGEIIEGLYNLAVDRLPLLPDQEKFPGNQGLPAEGEYIHAVVRPIWSKKKGRMLVFLVKWSPVNGQANLQPAG